MLPSFLTSPNLLVVATSVLVGLLGVVLADALNWTQKSGVWYLTTAMWLWYKGQFSLSVATVFTLWVLAHAMESCTQPRRKALLFVLFVPVVANLVHIWLMWGWALVNLACQTVAAFPGMLQTLWSITLQGTSILAYGALIMALNLTCVVVTVAMFALTVEGVYAHRHTICRRGRERLWQPMCGVWKSIIHAAVDQYTELLRRGEVPPSTRRELEELRRKVERLDGVNQLAMELNTRLQQENQRLTAAIEEQAQQHKAQMEEQQHKAQMEEQQRKAKTEAQQHKAQMEEQQRKAKTEAQQHKAQMEAQQPEKEQKDLADRVQPQDKLYHYYDLALKFKGQLSIASELTEQLTILMMNRAQPVINLHRLFSASPTLNVREMVRFLLIRLIDADKRADGLYHYYDRAMQIWRNRSIAVVLTQQLIHMLRHDSSHELTIANFYRIFVPNGNAENLKQMHKRLITLIHPDKNVGSSSNDVFMYDEISKVINEAWKHISDARP